MFDVNKLDRMVCSSLPQIKISEYGKLHHYISCKFVVRLYVKWLTFKLLSTADHRHEQFYKGKVIPLQARCGPEDG